VSDSGFRKVSKHHAGAGARNTPAFTIYRSGSGRFNVADVREYIDDDIEKITYYSNPSTNELGIALGGDEDGYKLTHADSGGAEASIRQPLREFGVAVDDLDDSHTLELEDKRREENLLVVDLTPVLEEADAE